MIGDWGPLDWGLGSVSSEQLTVTSLSSLSPFLVSPLSQVSPLLQVFPLFLVSNSPLEAKNATLIGGLFYGIEREITLKSKSD